MVECAAARWGILVAEGETIEVGAVACTIDTSVQPPAEDVYKRQS